MIVLLANRWNPAAEALAERWAAHSVALLTSADLASSGWVQHLSDPLAGIAVIGGQRVPQREITAVLPLMPCVFEEELTSIVLEDRAYVAAEMTAFLFSWLTRLPCSVLNRPTPPCLSGPFWRPERWVHLAARLGIPVQTLRRRATPDEAASLPIEISPATVVHVTIVGLESFGEVDVELRRHALALARSAGVDLLVVQFSGPGADALFLAAHTTPDLSSPSVADAVLALLHTAPSA